jgi:hypothetical protein
MVVGDDSSGAPECPRSEVGCARKRLGGGVARFLSTRIQKIEPQMDVKNADGRKDKRGKCRCFPPSSSSSA